MLVFVFLLLLIANLGHALQCIGSCSVGMLPFIQPFSIPDGQCQQRIPASSCSVSLALTYHDQMYNVEFNVIPLPYDFIYITSGPYLSYTIQYQCSKETNCVISYVQNRLNEMIDRAYNATQIYAQLAPYLEDPSETTGSLQCYDMNNQIVTCSSNEICTLDYDQRSNKIRSRGCTSENKGRVSVYDGKSYTSFEIDCARNLCNDITTYTQIKNILADNGLTDANGRRIAAGTKEIASYFLVAFALISVVILHL